MHAGLGSAGLYLVGHECLKELAYAKETEWLGDYNPGLRPDPEDEEEDMDDMEADNEEELEEDDFRLRQTQYDEEDEEMNEVDYVTEEEMLEYMEGDSWWSQLNFW